MNGIKLLTIVVSALFVVAVACSSSSSEVVSQPTPSPTVEVVSTEKPSAGDSETGDGVSAVASGDVIFADGLESSFSAPPLTPEQASCASELIGKEITNFEDVEPEQIGEVLNECMGFSFDEGISFVNEELLACTSDLFGREVTDMSELTEDEGSFAFEVCGPDLGIGIGGGEGAVIASGFLDSDGNFVPITGELPPGVTIPELPDSFRQGAGE